MDDRAVANHVTVILRRMNHLKQTIDVVIEDIESPDSVIASDIEDVKFAYDQVLGAIDKLGQVVGPQK